MIREFEDGVPSAVTKDVSISLVELSDEEIKETNERHRVSRCVRCVNQDAASPVFPSARQPHLPGILVVDSVPRALSAPTVAWLLVSFFLWPFDSGGGYSEIAKGLARAGRSGAEKEGERGRQPCIF
jgi:hypothetical protein